MRRWTQAARDDLRHMFQAALLAVTPQVVMREHVHYADGGLWIDGRAVDLRARRLHAIALGKAASGMASHTFWLERAAEVPLPPWMAATLGGPSPNVAPADRAPPRPGRAPALDSARPAQAHPAERRPPGARVVITPQGTAADGWTAYPGGHPLPDAASVRAGRVMLDVAQSTQEGDLLLLLLSGGGSAIAEVPLVPLEALRETTRLMLGAGADIGELNAVRKHLSGIKGGRLAEATRGSTLALAISDVPRNDPSTIASGPVAPDPTTYREAIDALRARDVWALIPAVIREHLEGGLAGENPETPKPGDRIFDRVEMHVLAGNRSAVDAAAQAAANRGYEVGIFPESLQGEARRMGERVAALAREAADASARDGRKRALIFGGETTVTVRGSGRGGRNTELALALVEGIAGRPIVAGCLATDGIDGTTDSAGAVADGFTLARGMSAGLDVEERLSENDSYAYFAALEDLIRTGPTGTNVMDVAVVLAGPPHESG
ncbi:MAG: glycerate kinase type-2 family protein [Thermoplasmatota archaeon]